MASLDRQKRHSHKFWIEVDVVRLRRAIQASLTGRGSVSFLGPGVETPGYRQSSLRDGCAYPASAAPADLRASRRPSRRCMPNGYTPPRSLGGTLENSPPVHWPLRITIPYNAPCEGGESYYATARA